MYDDGLKDTAAKVEGAPSRYYPARVLSVQGGVLNENLHSENGIPMVAGIGPRISAQLYGRYSIRFRADSAAGSKLSWLLSPQGGVGPRDGDIGCPDIDL